MVYSEIYDLCSDKKISVKELCAQIGMTYQGLKTSLETNKLDADKIELLCRALEITPNKFFGWNESVKKQQIQNGGVGNTQHMDSYTVELLQGQLNIKDEQIKEKDAQIAQLLKLITK